MWIAEGIKLFFDGHARVFIRAWLTCITWPFVKSDLVGSRINANTTGFPLTSFSRTTWFLRQLSVIKLIAFP